MLLLFTSQPDVIIAMECRVDEEEGTESNLSRILIKQQVDSKIIMYFFQLCSIRTDDTTDAEREMQITLAFMLLRWVFIRSLYILCFL